MRKLKNILLISTLFALNGCMYFESFQEPPGKGDIANEWYKRSEPIIRAIESFKVRTNNYPNSLQALVNFNSSTELVNEIKKGSFEYQIINNSYTLLFTYYRPGVNICVYKPVVKWKCSGYY